MVIGLIGGVGSGKSTVTDVLKEKYGFILFLTDDMAKELEQPGKPGYERLTVEFGEEILEGGAGTPVDKAKFASMIYSDEAVLEKVNSIIHPITWDYVEESIARVKEKCSAEGTEARIAVETALPCERYAKMCDEVWFVYTDEEVRIERLMASRGYSREKCISVIESQLSDEEFGACADYIIDNSGSREETEERIGELIL